MSPLPVWATLQGSRDPEELPDHGECQSSEASMTAVIGQSWGASNRGNKTPHNPVFAKFCFAKKLTWEG